MKNKLFTLQETADQLRISQRSVLRYLKAGKLKGSKLGNGKTSPWRISEKETKKFLKRYSNK